MAMTAADNARQTTTPVQLLVIGLISLLAVIGLWLVPSSITILTIAMGMAWLIMALWRLACLKLARPVSVTSGPPLIWPRYTVVAALYDEAAILPQLIERLSQIDYPHDRLEGFLALEADDIQTRMVAEALEKPAWLKVLIVPPGSPKTKPRALNHALAQASGDLITIYDAEDDPDPLQLKEAAARFCADGPDLICLQAPLRIRRRDKRKSATPFFDTQFAVEYAALFEVTLPALARLGLPFPLGGTSNHFRVSRLRELGGWDAWNVTEDADLGFRIWRTGGRLGVISRPTYETPPGPLRLWLPQRTRWLKGYLQTLLVHTRQWQGMGARGWLAMGLTIFAGVFSAAIHAISLAWIAAVTLISAISGHLPDFPPLAIGVLILGMISSLLVGINGARQAGVIFPIWIMVLSPIYWSMLSLAFAHAFTRLILEPHRWDKTPHNPELLANDDSEVFATAGRQAA